MAVNGAIPQQSLSNMSFGPPSSARDADADHSFIAPQQSLSNMSFGPPSSASDADADHSFIVLDRMTAEDSEKIVNELTASVCAFNINTNLGDSVTSTNHFGENPASTPSTYCNGELLSNLSDGSLSSEVRQRMNSLVLENTNLQVTVNQTNVALKQLMTTLEQCRGEMDQVRQEHKEKFQETRDLVLKLKKEKAEMRIVIEELQTKVEELQGQTPSDSLRDDNVRLGNALQNLSSVEKHSQEYQDAQVKGFIQRVDELTAKLMCTEEQLAKAKSEIAQLKSFEIVQHAESTMTLNEEALSNAKATVDRLRLRIDEMTAKIVELDQKCENQAQEISSLQKENSKQSELVGILQAQVEVYRTDFIAERDCREKLAGEKEQLALDLRRLHRHNLELQEQRTVTQEQGGQTSNRSAGQREEEPQNSSYRCPICQIMTFRTLQALNEHIDRCMENNSLS